jgi:translation initiation factor IF-2
MGLDDLVETLSTLAEIRDLRARETGKAEGYVLESHVDKGQGVVSTVLVSRGVLKTGSAIVAGQTWARVRTMFDSTGSEISSAGPGTPVTVTGWRDVPVAGDQMLEAINGEDEAKKAIDNRKRDAERKALAIDSEQINARREEDRIRAAAEAEDIKTAKEAGKNITHLLHAQRRAADSSKDTGKKELRLVVKGDVSGTVEAVEGSLSPIGNAEAGVKIIYTGVGDVNESDIMLAEASDAMVVGFNVECPRSILSLANMSGVPIHVDSVIYRLIDSVRGRVAGLLPPKVEYRITGEAVVQQVFEIKLGRKEVNVIAGCKVGNGIISRSEGVRVLRGPDREVIYEGESE